MNNTFMELSDTELLDINGAAWVKFLETGLKIIEYLGAIDAVVEFSKGLVDGNKNYWENK